MKLWRIRIYLTKITFSANYDTKKKILKSFFFTLIPYVRSKKKKQTKAQKNYLEPLGQNSSTYREWNLGVLNELLIYIYHNFYRWRILFSKYIISSFLELSCCKFWITRVAVNTKFTVQGLVKIVLSIQLFIYALSVTQSYRWMAIKKIYRWMFWFMHRRNWAFFPYKFMNFSRYN